MSTNLKKYTFLARKSPELAVYGYLNEAEKTAKEFAEMAIEKAINSMRANFEQNIKDLKTQIPIMQREIYQQLMSGARDYVTKNPNLFKGESGNDGYTPIKNKDYFDGLPGKDGNNPDPAEVAFMVLKEIPTPQDGIDGKDGSPDKPIEIADKLNTLKEKVEQSVIKGLEERFAVLKQNIREAKKGGGSKGGGGMGNVVTESFSVSSATTSITLANGVASGGNAIWLNFQGQQQQRSVHFTSNGGANIPLLFTPDDNTYIDVIYIRS